MTPEQFKTARAALDLTQGELARQLDVNIKTIGRYERGEAVIPVLVEFSMVYLDTKAAVM